MITMVAPSPKHVMFTKFCLSKPYLFYLHL